LVVNVKLLFIDRAYPLFFCNFYGNFVFVLRKLLPHKKDIEKDYM